MIDRRNFLKGSSLTAGLAATGGLLSAGPVRASEAPAGAAPLHSTRNLDRGRGLPGGAINFLIRSHESGGQFALMEGWVIRGAEPRPHTHTREDEGVQLLAGEIWFRVGDEEFEAKAGDFVFMPRGIEHEFKLRSDEVHVLVLITPGDFGEYFWRLGSPLTSWSIPPLPTAPPTPEQMEQIARMNAEYGLVSNR